MATNGVPSPTNSAFISHVSSYPVVSDSVDFFKSHPIGQKSIAVSEGVYDRFVKPFSPYIAKANGYASPYVTKVDNLADSGLTKVDGIFPIIKEPTDKVVGYPRKKAGDVIAFSQGFAGEQKDYVFKVYSDEYKKTGDKGLVPATKASVTTSIILTAQMISWLAGMISAKKDEVKDKAGPKADELMNKAGDKASAAKDTANEKVGEAQNYVDQHTN